MHQFKYFFSCFAINIILWLFLLPSSYVHAHDMRFGVIEAYELETGRYQITFRFSSIKLDMRKVLLKQAPNCKTLDFNDSSVSNNEIKFRWIAQCDNAENKYPGFHLYGLPKDQQIFVKIVQADGKSVEMMTSSAIIDFGNIVNKNSLDQKEIESFNYLKLGFQHILEGFDHLIVVLCFVLLFVNLKIALVVVTGFTIGHSLSLIFATIFNWQIPVNLVEIFILLSITFMTREIYFNSKKSLLINYPIIMSVAIGLVHGLGFSTALSEIGLPKDNTLIPILFFNLGVEIGQALFVIAGVVLLYILARLVPNRQILNKFFSVVLGSVSVLWLIQRFLNV